MVGRPLAGSDVVIGIDDTDNLDSPGTGFLAQRLLNVLAGTNLASACGATRHQLLFDSRIPYTSHNSSACLAVQSLPGVGLDDIEAAAVGFLRDWAAAGSDPGLAVVGRDVPADVRTRLSDYGHAAQTEVLTQGVARATARECGVRLSGHGGTEDGVIGALAAVGLHLGGQDGIFLWLGGSRTTLPGRYPYRQLPEFLAIADARTIEHERPEPDEIVVIEPWIRPVLQDGSAVLLLERHVDSDGHPCWRMAPKEVVKTFK